MQKAVSGAQSLHRRWSRLLPEGAAASKEELDWTTNELRNSLRSIEWDLEDLDETINILFRRGGGGLPPTAIPELRPVGLFNRVRRRSLQKEGCVGTIAFISFGLGMTGIWTPGGSLT